MPTPTSTANAPNDQATLTKSSALEAATFGMVAPPVPAVVQLAPQIYPPGQQPPPALAAQLNHPSAQLPCFKLANDVVVAVALAVVVVLLLVVLISSLLVTLGVISLILVSGLSVPVPVGTTTVTPSVFTKVVEAVLGQSVKPQLRPTLQQPP